MVDLKQKISGSTFRSLGISPWLCDALDGLSIKLPTEIQSKAIPAILSGKNVVASAKTGSGKTLAFALPVIHDLTRDPYGVFALILAPTRELCLQIGEQIRIVSASANIRLSMIVGGLDMLANAEEICSRPHIIIATPGRLADIINNYSEMVHFGCMKYLVMDEADKLLDPCFDEFLKVIIQKLPKKIPQILLFSATMTDKMKDLSLGSSKSLVIECCTRYETVDTIDQRYIFMNSVVRELYLYWLLATQFKDKPVIIFVSKCITCEFLRVLLKNLGIEIVAMHSKMKQKERTASLARFKGHIVNVLVTTDLGSRGLDIPKVDVVINYNLPLNPIDYIHRIGRTARAGRDGVTVSLVSQYDIQLLLSIEQKIEMKLKEYPSIEDNVLKLLNEVSLAKRVATTYIHDKRRDLLINKHKPKKATKVA